MPLLVMLNMSIYRAYASPEYKNVKRPSHCRHTGCLNRIYGLSSPVRTPSMKATMTSTNVAPTAAIGAAPFRFDAATSELLADRGEVAATEGHWWWIALAILCAILLFPLLLTDVPPLLDYSNHLARLMVLADNGADPILARFYRPNWGIMPNLGIDVIGLPLMWALPVHVAGRVLLGIVLLLPVLGTVAYSRAAFGRATWWSLGSVLVAYNAGYLQGFLNFMAGTGLALLLAAVWLRWRETAPLRTLAIAIPGAVVLFFCHLMGVVFFALLIGASELSQLPAYLRQPRRLALRVLYAATIFVVPAVLYRFSALQEMPDETVYLSLAKKAAQLLDAVSNYSLPLDIATAVLLAGGLILAAVTGHLRMPARSIAALVMIALLYLAAPFEYKGTYNLDMRFVVYLGFMLFGAVAPVGFQPRTGRLILAGVAALFIVRMAVLSDVWIGHNRDLAQLRAIIAHAEPGSLVFVTDVKPEEEPAYWNQGPRARWLSNEKRMDPHWPALLIIERRAWWPYLFDNPSQQPIRTRQPYRGLADTMVNLPPHRDLEVPGKVGLCGFDSVLLMIAGGQPDLAHYASDRLTLIAGNDTAALFRIRPDPACKPVK